MSNKKASAAIVLIIIVLLIALVSAWWYFGTHKSIPEAPQSTNQVSISSSTPQGQLVALWYQGKQLRTGPVMLDQNIQAEILPVNMLTPTTSPGQAVYQWQATTIIDADGEVTATAGNGSLINFQTLALNNDVFGGEVSTFGFQGEQYFIQDGSDCGTGYCVTQYNAFRLDADGNFKMIEAASGGPLWTASAPTGSSAGDFVGVVAIQDKLYLIDFQDDGIYTAILNQNGFERMAIATGSFDGVNLEDIIPGWNIGQ